MNLKKISLGLVALVGFGLLITLNAFSNGEAKRVDRYWQFNSGSVGDIRTGTSYTEISAPAESPCEDGTDLPCVLKVDASISSQSALDTYLHNTTVFPSPGDITSSALYQKEAE